jgi:glycosyltransferase involved in cell wall biosynthesis
MNTPLVSVIVPVYNGQRHLGEALQSVFAQDHRPLEVIVVDDGSTDGSATVAKSFPEVVYIFQPNAGVATARNTALRRATGSFVAFLDQDDQWTPDKLRTQLDYLHAHPSAHFVFAHLRNVLEVERPKWLPEKHVQAAKAGLMPGTLMVRREAFGVAGHFDPSYVNGSDSEWMLRATRLGLKYEIMPDVLLIRRVHDQNESHNREVTRRELFGLLHDNIRRRRETDPS